MKFSLIGCGGIGALRAEAISKIEGFELTAVCDVNEQAARALSEKFGGKVFDNWKLLLSEVEADAVVVSTPPHLHADISVAALKAGCHVLCEKALARNAQECQSMIDAAEQAGRKLATGFNYRFYPSIIKAKALFDAGLIGELDHIRSYAGYSATDHGQEWLHDFSVMGGGAFRDNGVHMLDLTCYFLGDVSEMEGMGSNHVWQFPGCEDNGFALLKNSSGKIATVQASWTEWRGYRLEMDIYGSHGYIQTSCFPMYTKVVSWPQGGGKKHTKRYFFPEVHLMTHLKSYRWAVIKSFIQELIEFRKYVEGKPSEVATGEDGLLTVKIGDVAGVQFSEEAAATEPEIKKENISAEPTLDLSVVIVILGGREYIPRCLAAINRQTNAPKFEVIIPCDNRISDIKELQSAYPSVNFISVPGVKTYAELRAIGVREARGRIIAVTEDHCSPVPGWMSAIMENHQSDFAAVGGAVDKSGKDTILNWSIYLCDFSRYMLPVARGDSEYLTDCNVSYKREELQKNQKLWWEEFHETTVNWALQKQGKRLLREPEMTVEQQRSLTYRFAFRERYAFGRLFATTRVEGVSLPKRLFYAVASVFLPIILINRIAKNVFGKKRERGKFIKCFPVLLLLNLVWTYGEFLGYLTGSYDEVALKQAERGLPAQS